MANKWTPGPWRITHQTSSDFAWDIVVDGHVLATAGYTRDVNSEIAANAKLIAKAPEMAEALKKLMFFSTLVGGFHSRPSWWEDDDAWQEWVEVSSDAQRILKEAGVTD